MQKTYLRWNITMHLLQMIISPSTFVCMLALGMAVPGMALAEDDRQFQPILCKPDQKDTDLESAECLERFKEFAARGGDALRLNLENGKTKIYMGNRNACSGHGPGDCLVFQLIAFYPSLQSFLVKKGLFECEYFELVSRRTGGITEFSTIPEWSPNGKYLIAVDLNDLCERKYDLAIWSAASDPPVLALKRDQERYEGWTIAGWDGDDRIRLQVSTNSEEGSYDQDVEAVRSGSGWKLLWGRISNVQPRQPASPQWPPAVPPSADISIPGCR
jgi:hypothetical protein